MTRPEITFRPLEGWPRPATDVLHQKIRPFKSHTIEANLRLLAKELGAIDTSVAVVQTAHDERDISRTTNRPRLDVKPKHPGVIVAADTKFGALKWVCDDCVNWSDNIRAVALTLERLRLAERYGVTKRGEQYAGWKMLPGPITAAASTATNHITVEAAAGIVGRVAEIPPAKIMKSRGIYEAAYRDAAKKLHPDAGGSSARWKELQDAKTLLDSFHNRK